MRPAAATEEDSKHVRGGRLAVARARLSISAWHTRADGSWTRLEMTPANEADEPMGGGSSSSRDNLVSHPPLVAASARLSIAPAGESPPLVILVVVVVVVVVIVIVVVVVVVRSRAHEDFGRCRRRFKLLPPSSRPLSVCTRTSARAHTLKTSFGRSIDSPPIRSPARPLACLLPCHLRPRRSRSFRRLFASRRANIHKNAPLVRFDASRAPRALRRLCSSPQALDALSRGGVVDLRSSYVDGLALPEVAMQWQSLLDAALPNLGDRPKLFIAADKDGMVARSSVDELVARAPEPKMLVSVASDHTYAGDHSRSAILAWLNERHPRA